VKRLVWDEGWWRHARRVRSTNVNARPVDAAIELVVIHSISLPPGEYGGDAIERLFTNRLDWRAHPYYAQLEGLKVSAHFVIRRDGRALQFASADARAWHAGVSVWRGRENCNDRSIGIELEGLEGERFDSAQYRTLARLLRSLRRCYPIAEIVGHEHVAPGRKADPGARFAWARLAREIGARCDRASAPLTWD
jgi:N-acetyl-anhydromuramoyl-L-alanine amidase